MLATAVRRMRELMSVPQAQSMPSEAVAADARPLLQVLDLSTWFDTAGGVLHAVDGVSFDIARGETFALLGESGCGKSMTALSLMQLVPAPGRIVLGSARLDGLDLLDLPEVAMRRVRGGRIAMIFQEPQTSLNPVVTIGFQIEEALRLHRGLRGRAARERAVELLHAVGIPDPARRYTEYPHQLSGGMKQRVMIAMALAGEPELLIADEPTTALDVTIQAQILELLRKLQSETGLAMLLITHDLGVVSETAHKVAVMYAGHIVEMAGRERFFSAPQHPYSQKLFESVPGKGKREKRLAVIPGAVPALTERFRVCRFAERCAFAWDACREIAPRWIETAPGHYVRCHLADPEVRASKPAGEDSRAETQPAPDEKSAARRTENAHEPLLQVQDLKVHFPIQRGLLRRVVGHVKAVDGVSLDIARGRTLALVGESGCGKTTVGKGILQLLRPTAGSVGFAGIELTRLTGAALRRRRRELQIIFQDPYASMNPRMTVQDIVEEGMVIQGIGGKRAQRQARVDALLEQVGLSRAIKRRYPHEFSGGQRQRICIARSLAVEPRLIVCDEPTSALDVSVQAQILNLLKGLQDRMGLAYLFITHNLAVVEYLAHEVAVMYLGRIVEQGRAEEVLESPKHPYTQALLSAVPQIDSPLTSRFGAERSPGDSGETANAQSSATEQRRVIRLKGDPPSPANPPHGCHFRPRCPQAVPACGQRYPEPVRLSPTHSVRCIRAG
jgi:peptide/nickel transport system ATP-binding protein